MIEIPELHTIWHYQAPRTRNHMPRIIPEGRQDIEIFVSGRGFFELENRTVEVTAGTVLWHRSGDATIYMADQEDPYACIVVAFLGETASPVPRLSQWQDRAVFHDFISRILTEFHSGTPDLRKLACYIYGQLYWQCQAPPEAAQPGHKRSPEINRVTDWIEAHFAEPIHLQQLSDMAGISIPHLHTLFKQITGQSPYQFIQARRLQESKILLASTQLPVREIARRSGFPDFGNFCRIFKTTSGITAQEFRLHHRDTR
ncbi:helix-turn-helix domain-containing protein [Gorillibacterium sp. sgz5001074]|uniref:AraC family transcriptional regulator n=1 Tax=Gorillibacterium sp. sgz5001074 TaxID=3446695 RepID=UPI003F680621